MLFFFNDTATTEIYTLSLHDALPISVAQADEGEGGQGGDLQGDDQGGEVAGGGQEGGSGGGGQQQEPELALGELLARDRKSTRLNSSHANISYAVFCLKKKKTQKHHN